MAIDAKQAQRIEKEAQNMPLEIGFKRLSDNAILPTKAHASDSGFDLFAAQDVIISPGETVVVPTDIAIQLPQGYEGQVRPRSGITSKTKLRVQIGTIDEQYRGNIGIIVDNITQLAYELEDFGDGLEIDLIRTNGLQTIDNSGYTPLGNILTEDSVPLGTYIIRKHDKIAQLVVQPIPTTVAVEITGELGETERGDKGYGSSGV